MRLPLVLALLSLGAGQAFAHAQLQKAEPPVGGTVKSSPSELRLTFSEGVEPSFSSVTLANSANAPVALGKAHTADGDANVLVAPVSQPLKPGAYVVTWHVVSVDTHRTQGSFKFKVAP